MEKREPLTLLVEMQTSTAAMENSGDFLKNWKQNCHMTQQSHFWAYTPRKPDLKETRAPNVHRSTVYHSQDMEAT